MRQLITNVHILTMDDDFTEYKNGYLMIENQKIAKLGKMNDTLPDATVVIDGKNGLLMPGMINTHTHIGMIPFRSLGDDVPDRLRRFLFPLEQMMSPELIIASAKYAIAEMLLAGVTSFCDMYYYEDKIAQATQEMKARALLGQTLIDMKTPDTSGFDEALKGSELFLKKWQGDEKIQPILAPHATNTLTKEQLEKILVVSKQYNAPITMHVAEMDYEMNYFRDTYNQTPVEFLKDLGYFEQHFIMAHGIFLTDSDIQSLKGHEDVSIAHCIGANTKSAKGVAPIRQMLKQGVTVGLGTDGPSSGNTLDLFTQMRMFANFHKTANKQRGEFPAKQIVELATKSGAKTLGLSKKVGSLEVGKQADIALIETTSVNMFPIFDAYSALVYSANAGNVSHTWVAGELLVKDKQLVHQKLESLRTDLYKEMREFVKEAKRRNEEV